MSSKLVKSQLNSVLRAIDKKQQGDGKKGGAQQGSGGRRGKRSRQARRQAAPEEQEEQKRTAVLAANLRFFAKTTTAKGKAQDLVTQVGHCMLPLPPPPPPPLPAAAPCFFPGVACIDEHACCGAHVTASSFHWHALPTPNKRPLGHVPLLPGPLAAVNR